MKNYNRGGSVIKLAGKRRKPYAVRVTTGWTDQGVQLRKYIGYYTTKAEAVTALAKYNMDPTAIDLATVTLSDVYDMWSALKYRDATESTIKGYTAAYNYLKPLQGVPMTQIKALHMEQCIADCPRSAGTKKKMLVLLRQLYEYAMTNDIIQKDYSRYVKLTEKAAQPNRPIFTDAEIATLTEALPHLPNIDMLLVAIYTGLRPAELLNLEKKNVDLKAGYLEVTESKTAAGLRLIPIADKIMPLIHKRMQRSLRYLFEVNGRKIGYDHYFRQIFQPIVAQLSLNPHHRPHDTRHTFATLLSNAEANPVSIKRLCGHSSYATTAQHYTHKTIDELKKAVNII